MGCRVLIAASNARRARALAEAVKRPSWRVDSMANTSPPRRAARYQLLVWEGSPRDSNPAAFLEQLADDCQVILMLPELDVRWASYYLDDARVNHFIGSHEPDRHLRQLADKLATGALFGLRRYLPRGTEPRRRRVTSYEDRCRVLDEIEQYASRRSLRGKTRRAAGSVAEELLMNAMYSAPVDERGRLLFDDVDPRERIRQPTPRPVSVRYAHADGALLLLVRDRFGSFRRDHLARYLLRCATEESPMEDKKRGAGLGLFQVVQSVTRLMIHIVPGQASEFIAVFDPADREASTLRLLSVSTATAPGVPVT